jgi:hypothetical protein
MAKENGKESAANLDSYYAKPNNIVDLLENSVALHTSGNLFGVKNKATDKYEWITYGAVAERVNKLRVALSQRGL